MNPWFSLEDLNAVSEAGNARELAWLLKLILELPHKLAESQ